MPVALNWQIDIQSQSSPAQHLFPHVVESLARIAPERIEDLASKSQGLTLAITADSSFKCEALPTFNLIHLSCRVVELAWAFGYVYWSIYRTLFSGKSLHGVVANPRGVPELTATMSLMDWATAALTDDTSAEWPANAPSPRPTCAPHSDEGIADEVALCALAMYMHHELAHVYAPRTPTMNGMDEEWYCDSAAADWILAGCTHDAAVLQKRAWGVAVGMLMLTIRGLRKGTVGDGIHPPGYARLVAALDGRVPPEQEAVWGLVVGMLALHIHDAKIPAHRTEYASFREAAIGLTAHLDATFATTTQVTANQISM